jgi:hypothetical protein
MRRGKSELPISIERRCGRLYAAARAKAVRVEIRAMIGLSQFQVLEEVEHNETKLTIGRSAYSALLFVDFEAAVFGVARQGDPVA